RAREGHRRARTKEARPPRQTCLVPLGPRRQRSWHAARAARLWGQTMTSERIDQRFAALRAEGRTALVIYLTIGDPSVEDSIACALAAVHAGADVLEIGVPFSDPTADGPVIAAAAYRAIHNGGSFRAA